MPEEAIGHTIRKPLISEASSSLAPQSDHGLYKVVGRNMNSPSAWVTKTPAEEVEVEYAVSSSKGDYHETWGSANERVIEASHMAASEFETDQSGFKTRGMV